MAGTVGASVGQSTGELVGALVFELLALAQETFVVAGFVTAAPHDLHGGTAAW